MLASLLPGIRELRAPLAAGYIWLAFLYIILGTPETAADFPGPVESLVKEVDRLGTAATAAALSFVAYLIGSISQDLFGRLLPIGLEVVWRWRFFSRGFTLADGLYLPLSRLTRWVNNYERDASSVSKSDALKWILDLTEELRDARYAGASEAERPEALRPMVEAEENLRIAIVPPVAALSIAVAFSSPVIGIVGFCLSLALYVQAAVRHLEARELAIRYQESRELEELETALVDARRVLTLESPNPYEVRAALIQVLQNAGAQRARDEQRRRRTRIASLGIDPIRAELAEGGGGRRGDPEPEEATPELP